MDLICGSRNHRILQNERYIGRIHVLDKKPNRLLSFFFGLKRTKYDIFIDPKDHSSTESKLIAKWVRAEKKVGYENNHQLFDEYLEHLDSPENKSSQRVHYSARMMQALSAIEPDLKIDKEGYRPRLTLSELDLENVRKFLKQNAIDDFTVLNISASAPKRCPSSTFWEDFIAESGLKGNLIISAAPEDKSEAEALFNKLRVWSYTHNSVLKVFLYEEAPFTEVSALISLSRLLISPDTAVVHVAAAFDIPLFGLFSRYEMLTRSFYPLSSNKALVWAEDDNSHVRGIRVENALEVWKQSGIYEKAFL